MQSWDPLFFVARIFLGPRFISPTGLWTPIQNHLFDITAWMSNGISNLACPKAEVLISLPQTCSCPSNLYMAIPSTHRSNPQSRRQFQAFPSPLISM